MNKLYKKMFGILLTGAMILSPAITADAASVVNGSYVKGDNENNPIVTQNYGADPGVMVYGDTVYVYTTNDTQQFTGNNENKFDRINQLNCYSSKDMVNWTDHGAFNIAGKNGAAKWANNSWAPTICSKRINGKDKFFLYFANNASSIGVLTADSPTGPWRDPIGRALITKSTPNCNVEWLFDPAVLVDSDGTGYLYFGGGVPAGQAAHPKTARVIKLGNDMTSTVGTAATIDAPYLFEDSGINKIGNTYYYSYCSNWNCSNGFRNATIQVMTSRNPMGPFTYQGEIMANPASAFRGSDGNNHHQIFEFKGNYYMAYHTHTVETQIIRKNLGYRSTHIDRVDVSNGRINTVKQTLSGVPMNPSVDPYSWVQAETLFTQAGITVKGNGDGSAWVSSIDNGDFTKVKGVKLSKGVKSITATVLSNGNGSIDVREGSPSGKLLCNIPVSNTNGAFKDFSANVSNVSGTKDLCFVFHGNFAFDRWMASATEQSSTPAVQEPENVNTNSTASIANGWYYLKNTNSQKYLTVQDDAAKPATNVCISTGTGVKGQKWYVENKGDGYITLKSGLGDFMLDVANGADEDGANLQIYTAYGHDAQQFIVKTTKNNGVYTIGTKSSSATKYIDVYEHKKTDGTNVCQWTFYGNPNQEWIFEPVNNSNNSQASAPQQEPTQQTPAQEPAQTQPESKPETKPETKPASKSLDLSYSINSWNGGYNVSLKIENNTGATVDGWTIKIKKSDVTIDLSWNMSVKTEGNYYVITPSDWNKTIAAGQSVEIGFQGSGAIGSTIDASVQ